MDLKELIKRHEGKRLKIYLCSADHHSIGYGWNIDANPLPSDIASYLRLHGEITEEMADQLLDTSIEAATWQCRDLYPGFDGYSEARRFALVDLTFNLGAGRIKREFPSFLKAIKEKNWQRAADEIKYTNGITKETLSGYWKQLGGDPDGTDDGRKERPEEIYQMITNG